MPTNFRFSGDEVRARLLTQRANKYLRMLEERMSTTNQRSGKWTVTEHDGTRFDVSIFGNFQIANIHSPAELSTTYITRSDRESLEVLPARSESADALGFMWVGGRILNAEDVDYYDHIDEEYLNVERSSEDITSRSYNWLGVSHGPVNIRVTEPGVIHPYIPGRAWIEGVRWGPTDIQVLAHGLQSRFNTASILPYTATRCILASRTYNGLYTATVPWCYDFSTYGLWHGFAMLDPKDPPKDLVSEVIQGYPGTIGGAPLFVDYGPYRVQDGYIISRMKYHDWAAYVSAYKRPEITGSFPMVIAYKDALNYYEYPGDYGIEDTSHQCTGTVLDGMYRIDASVAHRNYGYRFTSAVQTDSSAAQVPVTGSVQVEIQIHVGPDRDHAKVYSFREYVDTRWGSVEPLTYDVAKEDLLTSTRYGTLYAAGGGYKIIGSEFSAGRPSPGTNWVDAAWFVDVKRRSIVKEQLGLPDVWPDMTVSYQNTLYSGGDDPYSHM